MFNNNYERNLRNKYNNSNENQNNIIGFKLNNNLDQKQLSKNLFFDNVNLFNQRHSNNNIPQKKLEQNNSYNQNIFMQNSEKKSRDLNYNNYSKFYGETNNQPYPIFNKDYNNLHNNFQNIHNINTINNNLPLQNTFRYNDLNYQKNELNNISNGYNKNIYTNQSRRSYSEMNRRNTPNNEEINTLQNKNRFFNNNPINYSNQNFYHGKNIINQIYNNTNYPRPSVSQSSPINNISNDIIDNNMNYNSSNNTINNFYEQMQKEKERKQKEDYSNFLRQQIEEKRKRKEMERQKEKEYDLQLERKNQEYLKQQKEIENNNKNENLFEQNTIKRPISNREKTISDLFNENNINSNIINSIQNSQQSLNPEKIKNRTNYNNFNNNIINEEPKTRNKKTISSSSFLNSGKGIMDSFNKQTKTVDEFKHNLNINNNEFPLNNNNTNIKIQNNNINNIKEDKFGFTFKNKAETEEMIDKIIKEADDYLKGTLQQSFTNKEEKEVFLYKMLNNGQNPNQKIEFQGTFGSNNINQNLQKTSQFNIAGNQKIQNKRNNDINNNKIENGSNKKNNENNILPRKMLKDNENNYKKDEIKKEKKNDIVNIDELLKGIDLKALNYHSKYEETEEKFKKIKLENNINNENQNKNLEGSMKSLSKLVSPKTNNETWKEGLKDKMKKENDSNDGKDKNEEDKKEEENNDIKNNNKNEIENKKKIMSFLNNRKKEKKIKYKLSKPILPSNEQEVNLNVETKQQAINSSIKLNGSLNPNLKITFGNGGNLFSNQSIKFNQDITKNENLSKFTFGQNLENVIKNNNTSIQNMNESDKEENNYDESFDDEEKYDIKDKNENDINYDDMLNKNDDLKFLDFDNFLDISKINKNKTDVDDLCNIRYTTEEEQQQNKKVKEALKDAVDSSDEENQNKKDEEDTKIQDIVNFSGENTLGLNYNNNKENNIDIENTNKKERNKSKENNPNTISSDMNKEKNLELKESHKEEINNDMDNSSIKSLDNEENSATKKTGFSCRLSCFSRSSFRSFSI